MQNKEMNKLKQIETQSTQLQSSFRKVEPKLKSFTKAEIIAIFEKPDVGLTIEKLGKTLVKIIDELQSFSPKSEYVWVKSREACVKAIELGLKARGIFEENKIVIPIAESNINIDKIILDMDK